MVARSEWLSRGMDGSDHVTGLVPNKENKSRTLLDSNQLWREFLQIECGLVYLCPVETGVDSKKLGPLVEE